MPGTSIDLNADLGEGCAWDAPLLAAVTSASICCGAHAGGGDAGRATLEAARARGVAVGAHPGYPDREGFGRRERVLHADEAERMVRDQVATLDAWADEVGVVVRFLKPHGAMYNQAQVDDVIAAGIIAAAKARSLPLLGLPGSRVEALASRAGVRFIAEGFADRAYRPDGRLVPRTEPGAMLDDPAEIAAQVLRLVDRGVATLCLHGDNPHSVALAALLRKTLDGAGVAIRPFV